MLLWQRLGDGYRVEASFILWEEEDVLTIPASTLFRYGGQGEETWAVFVIDGDSARRVMVETGQRNGLTAQVVSGLDEGQQLITHPGEMIDDGVKVQVR